MDWKTGPPGWVWPALFSSIVAALWLAGGFIPGPMGAQAKALWVDSGALMTAWMATTMGLWLGYKGFKAASAMKAVGGVQEAVATAATANGGGGIEYVESDPDAIVEAGEAASREG